MASNRPERMALSPRYSSTMTGAFAATCSSTARVSGACCWANNSESPSRTGPIGSLATVQ